MVTPQSEKADLDDREDNSPQDLESTPAETSPEPAGDADCDGQLPGEQPQATESSTFEEEPEPSEESEEDLHEQLQEARQQALRHQAELENSRKRLRREMEDQQRYAGIPLMRDLLPALDNLRRAIESAEPTTANQGVLSGVEMVCEQLESILAQHQCCRIEAEGTMFDPNLHEAVVQQPSSEYPPGTIVKEIQVGYQLLDRIVRPTQVMVAQSPETPQENAPDNPEEGDP